MGLPLSMSLPASSLRGTHGVHSAGGIGVRAADGGSLPRGRQGWNAAASCSTAEVRTLGQAPEASQGAGLVGHLTVESRTVPFRCALSSTLGSACSGGVQQDWTHILAAQQKPGSPA